MSGVGVSHCWLSRHRQTHGPQTHIRVPILGIQCQRQCQTRDRPFHTKLELLTYTELPEIKAEMFCCKYKPAANGSSVYIGPPQVGLLITCKTMTLSKSSRIATRAAGATARLHGDHRNRSFLPCPDSKLQVHTRLTEFLGVLGWSDSPVLTLATCWVL